MKERIDNKVSKFWNKKSNLIFWQKSPNKIFRFNRKKLNYEWFYDGKTNICYNCLDKHVKEGLKNKIAIHTVDVNGEIVSIVMEGIPKQFEDGKAYGNQYIKMTKDRQLILVIKILPKTYQTKYSLMLFLSFFQKILILQ